EAEGARSAGQVEVHRPNKQPILSWNTPAEQPSVDLPLRSAHQPASEGLGLEPERYELQAALVHHFDLARRDFFKAFGAGVVVLLLLEEVLAQESGGGRRR